MITVKKTFKLIAIILISFTVIGCETYLVQEYAYEEPMYLSYDWGELHAKLDGWWIKADSDEELRSVLTSPYKVLISFRSKEISHGAAEVSNIELYDAENNKIVYEGDGSQVDNFEFLRSDGYYYAFITVSKLDVDYVRYKLSFKYKIISEDETIEDTAAFIFKKNYKEYRKNLFWSRLMSV